MEDKYLELLKKDNEQMWQNHREGKTKGMSMIDIMAPAQRLFNYVAISLQREIEKNVNS